MLVFHGIKQMYFGLRNFRVNLLISPNVLHKGFSDWILSTTRLKRDKIPLSISQSRPFHNHHFHSQEILVLDNLILYSQTAVNDVVAGIARTLLYRNEILKFMQDYSRFLLVETTFLFAILQGHTKYNLWIIFLWETKIIVCIGS